MVLLLRASLMDKESIFSLKALSGLRTIDSEKRKKSLNSRTSRIYKSTKVCSNNLKITDTHKWKSPLEISISKSDLAN
jgi:hypothetical protein